MKRFIMIGSIDQALIEKFISVVESSGEERIAIYLTSRGGASAGLYILRQIIDENPDKFEVHAIENIFSAAFEFFFHIKCKRYIAPGTIGMSHLAGSEMRMSDKSKPYYDEDKETLKGGKFRIAELTELLESIGAKLFINKVLKGEDVYFQSDILRQFLNYEAGRPPVTDKRRVSKNYVKGGKVAQLVQGQELTPAADNVGALQKSE